MGEVFSFCGPCRVECRVLHKNALSPFTFQLITNLNRTHDIFSAYPMLYDVPQHNNWLSYLCPSFFITNIMVSSNVYPPYFHEFLSYFHLFSPEPQAISQK